MVVPADGVQSRSQTQNAVQTARAAFTQPASDNNNPQAIAQHILSQGQGVYTAQGRMANIEAQLDALALNNPQLAVEVRTLLSQSPALTFVEQGTLARNAPVVTAAATAAAPTQSDDQADDQGFDFTLAADLTQMTLDITGMIEPTPFSDGANGIISLGRGIGAVFSGNWSEAGGHGLGVVISAASLIPYLGDLAKAGKLGKWADTVTRSIEAVINNPAARAKLEPLLRGLSDAINAIPQAVWNKMPDGLRTTLEGIKNQLDSLFGRADLTQIPVGDLSADILARNLDNLNVTSAPDTAIFYSGRGARDAAESHAAANGMTTLETTAGGQYLDDLRLFDGTVSDVDGDTAMSLWGQISTRYAEQASGSVTAFVNSPRPDSVFLTRELPALLSNNNVTDIVIRSGSGQSVTIPRGTSIDDALAMIGKIL